MPYLAREVLAEWDQSALAREVLRSRRAPPTSSWPTTCCRGRCAAPRRRTARAWRSCTPSTPPTSTATVGCCRCRWRPRWTASRRCARELGLAPVASFGALLDRQTHVARDLPGGARPAPARAPANVRYVGPAAGGGRARRRLASARGRRRSPARRRRAGHDADGRGPGAPAAADGARRRAGAGDRDAGRPPGRGRRSTCRTTSTSAATCGTRPCCRGHRPW